MIKKIILWFMQTDFYSWATIKVIPFIRFSMYYTKTRGDKYHEGYYHLKPGMIIGTIDYRKLTGLLIPRITGGVLSHVALCVAKRDPKYPDALYSFINPLEGQGNGIEIAEMTHMHFTFSDFFDICKESDRVIIFECVDWDELHIRRVVQKALDFKEIKYDARFDHNLRALYCSELILAADSDAGYGTPRLKCDLSDLMGLGKPYISPDGLLCAKNVRVVWDSKGEFNGMRGQEIKDIIFKGAK